MYQRLLILNQIEADLKNILISNGYQNNVKSVSNHYVTATGAELEDGFKVGFDIEREESITQPYEDEFTYVCSLPVGIVAYCKKGFGESVLGDLTTLFARYKTGSVLRKQAGIKSTVILKRDAITQTNYDIVTILLQIDYNLTPLNNLQNIVLPSIPVITNPTNGQTNLPLQTNIDWNPITEATDYHIQISTSNAFDSTVIDQQFVVSSSYTVPLDNALVDGTIYYVKVRSRNQLGYSAWSNTIEFTPHVTTVSPLSPVDLGCTLWLNSSAGVVVDPHTANGIMEWDDQSGYNRNFAQTDNNAYPTLASGYYNHIDAVYFNPENAPTQYNNLNYDDNANDFQINGSQQACVMVTMIPNDVRTNHSALLGRTDPNVGGEWNIYAQFNQVDRLLPFFETPKGNNTTEDAICPANFSDNQLVQNIFNYSINNVQVWQNGIKVNNEAVTFPVVTLGVPKMNLGSYYYYTSYGGVYAGYIFHVAIFNRVLSDLEIAELYAWHKQFFGIN